jgi:hypothetical protein
MGFPPFLISLLESKKKTKKEKNKKNKNKKKNKKNKKKTFLIKIIYNFYQKKTNISHYWIIPGAKF